MGTTGWIVVAVVVVIALALVLALVGSRRARTTRLREQYGDEYDHRVQQTGSDKQARQELAHAQERRDGLDVRDLDPGARERYLQRWKAVQAAFVDDPGPAVDDADALVQDVMRERGYLVDDFATRADLMAVDHPEVVQDYRAASDARRRHHEGGDGATTEELRRAMVHYRALFERLVEGAGVGSGRHMDTAQQRADLRAMEDQVGHQADQAPGRHSR